MVDDDSGGLGGLLAVARGEAAADLVLRGGRVVNVFSGEVEPLDVALAGERIAGLGRGYAGREEVDLGGAFVSPGWLDAHVHIESAMVPPAEFAAVVVPRGVTAVVADPHEIANVCGAAGIDFMLRDAAGSDLTVYLAAPSCVPATSLSTSGAELSAGELAELRRRPRVASLGELMDYPGAVAGQPDVLDKIRAFEGLPLDGHAPGLGGQRLCAYVAAGMSSDHECSAIEEAREKLALGMRIFVREATGARNLRALLPLICPANAGRFCLCTDDRQLPDLFREGSVDGMLRTAISAGLDPVTAIRLATLNVAEHFGLAERGAVAPGRLADLVVFRRLDRPTAERVYVRGRLVARDGKLLGDSRQTTPSGACSQTVRVDWARTRLEVPATGRRLRVIGVVADQLRTDSLERDARVHDRFAVADPERDLLKIAVIERHRGSGAAGLGFVQGLGLARGAIASTVAHDHHNLIVAGADDRSMMTAARAVAEGQGGLAAAEGEAVLASLALPIAGLMSPLPAERVAGALERLIAAARSLGSPLADPFMTLSFLGLEVIPSLKLTDRGLVDVERMELVPLFVD